jgi:predicted PurR-regulated permease PerM
MAPIMHWARAGDCVRADFADQPTPPSPGREPGNGLLSRLQPIIVFATILLAVACLARAQAVFVPLALAFVLVFILSPVVTWLERRIGRSVAVVLVLLLVLVAVASVGYLLTSQLVRLGNEVPNYKSNIRKKVADVRWLGRDGSLQKVQRTVEEAVGEATETGGERTLPNRPVPVIVQEDQSSQIWSIPTALGPWLEPLATGGFVLVLVAFMLIERTELRNRVIRLVGHGRLALTTKALDEAAARISRYLLMQSLVNAVFGLGVGVGLVALGVPYALLWAFLAAVLRFIPYVGPWLAALLPIALSLAVFEGWVRPALVIALFLGLELFTNMVLETFLYASSAGVSQVALLVAVAFWTWLWGPVGLMLATPLTVCLVVLAKYVPALEFVGVLFGDAPVLEPHVTLYQRLLAGDHDEAAVIVEEFLEHNPAERVFDDLFLPALALAKRDRSRRRLGDDDERVVLQTTREVLEEVAPPVRDPDPAEAERPRARILGCPARDAFDELGLEMLRQVLQPSAIDLEPASSALLSSEVIARVEAPREDGNECPVLCIATVAPGGIAQVRYLAKRLRARVPGLRIVVGRWGAPENLEEAREAFTTAGVDEVADTLLATRDQLQHLCQLRAEPAAAPTA